MLHIDLSRLFRSTERKLAASASVAEEGCAAIAIYEDGELRVGPSTGAADEVFVGVMFSSKTTLDTLPMIEKIRATAGSVVTLSRTPVGGTIRVINAANTVITAGNPTTTDDRYSISGNVLTLHSSDASTDITVQYQYSPTILEARTIQGDVEPGGPVSNALRMTGLIEGGEVFTSEFDTAADWSDPSNGVKLGANGKFTVGGSGGAVNAIITKVPTVGSPVLGLTFNV